jgi:hypothetical protein
VEEIPLNDLPAYTDWVSRLLGEEEWSVPERTPEYVEREYDQQKYARLLEYKRRNPDATLGDVREFQAGRQLDDDERRCLSRDETMYTVTRREVRSLTDQVLRDAFHDVLTGGETVVELGAGYGSNLGPLSESYPNCTFVGGDLSENAVQLGRQLFEDNGRVQMRTFDFYGDWSLLEEYDDVVLFTRHAIEQLPVLRPEISKTIRSLVSEIDRAIHLEPVYECHPPEKLLGQLRRSYTRMNDYNRDLARTLEGIDTITVERTAYDRIGVNPLNPTSEIRWRPTSRNPD